MAVVAAIAAIPLLQGGGIFDGEGNETKIVFESILDGDHEIYIMNANGTGVTRITNETARDADLSFPLRQKR